MLYRYADVTGVPLPAARSYPGFGDAADIAAYADEAVAALYTAGVVNGRTGGVFGPGGQAVRAEAVAMLHRFLTAQ
jgi:hypothetical protein